MDVTVFVQTCPQRREIVKATMASLERSDASGHIVVMEHPEGVEKCRFYRTILEAMAQSSSGHVIRCEDDIIVNRHLLHNYLTWPALRNPLFGCGWLYVSELAAQDRTAISRGELYRTSDLVFSSLCVGMPVEHARWCLDRFDRMTTRYGCALETCQNVAGVRCSHRKKEGSPRRRGYFGQDGSISLTMFERGRRVFFHRPALAENRLVPSTHGIRCKGDIRHYRAGPLFNAEWKRRCAT